MPTQSQSTADNIVQADEADTAPSPSTTGSVDLRWPIFHQAQRLKASISD